jgi:hypothetical protein
MQRVLHSILTARILLNLREAASRDRVRKGATSSGEDPVSAVDETQHADTPPALSSVVTGVDSWFIETAVAKKSTTIDMA